MKKYIIVAGFSALSLLLGEDNPFSISEYLQKLEQEKTAFLDTLHETGNSSTSVSTKSNQVKKISIEIPPNSFSSPKVNQSMAISSRLPQEQIEIPKRIAKAKKIRQEPVEALRIKNHIEEIRRIKQKKLEKFAQEKCEVIKRKKKQIKSAKMDKVDKNRHSRSLKGKDPSLKKKEVVEQVYLDAIKAVNQ